MGRRGVRIIALARNISAEKKLSEERDTAHRLLNDYEGIINRSPAVALILKANNNWTVEFVSENILQFGYDKEILERKGAWKTIVHPDDIIRIEKELEGWQERGVVEFVQEYRLLTKSGEICWVEDYKLSVLNSRGNITHYQSLLLDASSKKQEEFALRASEKRFRMMTENSSDIIAEFDHEGRYLYVNPRHQEILGYAPEELQTQRFFDHIHPDDMKTLKDNFNSAMASAGIVWYATLRYRQRSGAWRWLEICGRSYRNASGKPRMATSSRDITDHRFLDRMIEQQLEFLETMMNTLPNPVYYKNTKGEYIGCNRSFEEFIGYPREQIIGKKSSDLFPSDLSTGYWEKDLELFAHPGKQIYEGVVPRKSGEHCDVVFNKATYADPEGNVAGLIGILIDVTEQKRMQTALRLSKESFNNIVEKNADGVIIVDADGIVRFLNPAAEIFLGKKSSALIGRPFSLPIVEDQTLETDFVDQEGYSGVAQMRVISTEWNREPASLISVRDITQLKQAEIGLLEAKEATDKANEQLLKALEQARELAGKAEEANRAKSAFLATMTHEIRTPLTGVLGITNTLIETKLSPAQMTQLELIISSTSSLMGIINDILDFSKIEAGRLELQSGPFDLRELLESAGDLLALSADSKGITLHVHLKSGTPRYLLGDEMRLRQILLNLAGNGVKFTEKGYVLLEAACCGVKEDSALLEFKVLDTGIGIRQEDRDIIFDKFTQCDSSATRKYSGTGLGLAITRQLVEMMKGSISLNSEPGVGSAFVCRIALPIARDMPPPPEEPMHNGLRVLLIDNDPICQEIVSDILLPLGVECVFEEDVGAGLSLLHKSKAKFHAVIFRDGTGGISWEEMTGRFHLQAPPVGSRTILLARPSRQFSLEELHGQGLDGCLALPLKASQLLYLLKDIRHGKTH
ncbi:MAG: hypothetical protein A2X49_16990 [Lentisphaerae bacterium GWF2_52_8]|nr:MAG: hypothetical protein A2X49_16990 [Lentisphaerae bacterium GWF2_52_8]